MGASDSVAVQWSDRRSTAAFRAKYCNHDEAGVSARRPSDLQLATSVTADVKRAGRPRPRVLHPARGGAVAVDSEKRARTRKQVSAPAGSCYPCSSEGAASRSLLLAGPRRT